MTDLSHDDRMLRLNAAADGELDAAHWLELERDMRAIDAKIESLAESAIKPEALERIRAQTEEVRNLIAAAAMRAPPAERLALMPRACTRQWSHCLKSPAGGPPSR